MEVKTSSLIEGKEKSKGKMEEAKGDCKPSRKEAEK